MSFFKNTSALLASSAVIIVLTIGFSANSGAANSDTPATPTASTTATTLDRTSFETLLRTRDAKAIKDVISQMRENWSEGYIPILLELTTYSASYEAERGAFDLLKEKTGQNLGRDANDWYAWWWNQPAQQTADYADFKAELYRLIDPRFETYFKGRQETARIRLDEIRWGGVLQDGIPPLRSPEMIAATDSDADYLQDENVVFGIEINGDARAYPKRILAWHEMFVDTVGGVDIAGVYCTLCGTVIPYKTNFNGTNHALGTSGFLYRSNKLMYDAATQSMWNKIKGEPVLGPLVGKGIKLEHLSVVTTTWAEWKRRHPDTQVLSLNTGHRRDYGEGVAYNDYFATDRLMFNTPFNDTRLKNKQEVLALRFTGAPGQQLAIDTDFLAENPIYADRVGPQNIVVITDQSGANRVYDPGNTRFVTYNGDSTLTDETGEKWTLTEAALTSDSGQTLDRLPYHRAFWFGWKATFPDTRLVKSG